VVNSRALDAVYYTAYAMQRLELAHRVRAEHQPSAWTGCCAECGRPAPCEERLTAERTLVGPA
jgi:hypothetical protein